MTMKVSSSLAAFALFGNSIAISLSPDASVEQQLSWQPQNDGLTDDCCLLYSEEHFGGQKSSICVSVRRGTRGNSMHLGTIHSWRCGKDTKITFCDSEGPKWAEDSGWHCPQAPSDKKWASAGRVDNYKVEWQAGLQQSAGVEAFDLANHGGPLSFSDVDANGYCYGAVNLHPITDLEQPTYYNELRQYWEAVQVPYGYSVSLYNEKDYTDLYKVYDAEMDEVGRMKCQANFTGGKGQLAPQSMIVQRSGSFGAQGIWKLVGQSLEEMDFSYTSGFTKGQSDSTTKTDERTMTESMGFSMTIGIPDEMGITESYSMSSSYKNAVTQQATKTMTTTATTTFTTSCTPAEKRSGVQLYQWVVQSGDLSIGSVDTVCRYDNFQNSAPKCPPQACADPKCLQCRPDWNPTKI